MTLLAIDTSSAATIVAVASDDGTLLAERRHEPQGRDRPQHTTLTLALAADALAEAASSWQALTRIGVGIGPGSFTGLRSGISAATALALRLGVGVVGVRGSELLAAGAGEDGRAVWSVIDGRRRELFVERFDDPARAPLGVGATQVIAATSAAELPRLAGSLAIGDGAVLAAELLRGAGAEVPEPEDPRHRISGAALIARTLAGTPVPPSELRPAYGREPDAVPTAERERR